MLRPRSPSFPRCKAAFLPAWCVAASAPHLCALLQVKKAGSRVVFLLVDKETAKCHSEQKTQFKRETASLKLLPHQPRVVVIQKGSNGYGFYLRAGPEQKGETQDSRPSPESLLLSAGPSSSCPTGELPGSSRQSSHCLRRLGTGLSVSVMSSQAEFRIWIDWRD